MTDLDNIVDDIETYDINANKALAYGHILIHLMELKEIIGFAPHPNEHIQAVNNMLDKDFKKHIDNFIKYFNNKHRQLIIKNETDE